MSFEFILDGQSYRAEKLNVFQQLHVSRKIATLVPPLIPIFLQAADEKGLTGDLGSLSTLLEPLAQSFASMPDEAAEYVISTCMSVVRRRQGENWMPVWSASSKVTLFDDLDAGVLIRLAIRVIQESLGPFISGLLTNPPSSKTLPTPPAA